MSERPIFRERAIQAYRRGRDKDVVPRLISWPIVVCLWLLLAVLIAATFVAWQTQVPIYVAGSGILLASAERDQSAGGDAVAILLLPSDQASRLRVGLPADIELSPAGMHMRGTITEVKPDVVSPQAARQHYGLAGPAALLITQPSVVASARLSAALPANTYAGSLVTARVEIGSQRILALLPGLGRFLGNGS